MEHVRLTRLADGVGKVTLNRPERRNAINAQIAAELREAVSQITTWGIAVAVLDANGPAFCAGADLGDLKTSAPALDDVLDTLMTSPIHWTAAVRGAVRGGGMALIAACPQVYATPGATFGLPELARGFFPSDLVNRSLAGMDRRFVFDLAFSNRPISAAVGRERGLVTGVVEDELLDGCLLEETRRLASYAPGALLEGVRLWQARAWA